MIHTSVLSPKIKTVVVEYTANNLRVTKNFTDNGKARRFYITKSREGKEPKIVSASLS